MLIGREPLHHDPAPLLDGKLVPGFHRERELAEKRRLLRGAEALEELHSLLGSRVDKELAELDRWRSLEEGNAFLERHALEHLRLLERRRAVEHERPFRRRAVLYDRGELIGRHALKHARLLLELAAPEALNLALRRREGHEGSLFLHGRLAEHPRASDFGSAREHFGALLHRYRCPMVVVDRETGSLGDLRLSRARQAGEELRPRLRRDRLPERELLRGRQLVEDIGLFERRRALQELDAERRRGAFEERGRLFRRHLVFGRFGVSLIREHHVLFGYLFGTVLRGRSDSARRVVLRRGLVDEGEIRDHDNRDDHDSAEQESSPCHLEPPLGNEPVTACLPCGCAFHYHYKSNGERLVSKYRAALSSAPVRSFARTAFPRRRPR